MSVYETLTKGLDRPIRLTIERRVEAMMRQIGYLAEVSDERLGFLQQRGWTHDRLAALCTLNSFYQIVVGPLASSARGETRIGLGDRLPIEYGDEIRFDSKRSAEMRALHIGFMDLVAATRLPFNFLHANHADDLIFTLFNYLHASENE
jgi:hypothetical protein